MRRTAAVSSVAGTHELVGTTWLLPGDVIFCRKASFMQRLLDAVGDPWRHACLVVTAGEAGPAVVAEVTGGPDLDQRTVEQLVGRYDVVAVGRPGAISSACIDRAVEWARLMVGSSQIYPWDDVLLTGLILSTRKLAAAGSIDRLAAALSEVAAYNPPPARPSMTCSAFVFEAFRRAGDGCGFPVNLRQLGPTPDRPHRGELTVVPADEAALVEALAATDLWALATLADQRSQPNAVEAVTRGHSRSHASVSQILRSAQLIASTVEQYSNEFPSTDGSPFVDGRWVSPGDIWRSEALVERRYLKV